MTQPSPILPGIAPLLRTGDMPEPAERGRVAADILLLAPGPGGAMPGCYALAADAGSTPEFLKEGESGLLAGSRDPEELAGLALSILTDRRLARTLGHRGRSVARAHDFATVTARFLAICDGHA